MEDTFQMVLILIVGWVLWNEFELDIYICQIFFQSRIQWGPLFEYMCDKKLFWVIKLAHSFIGLEKMKIFQDERMTETFFYHY